MKKKSARMQEEVKNVVLHSLLSFVREKEAYLTGFKWLKAMLTSQPSEKLQNIKTLGYHLDIVN